MARGRPEIPKSQQKKVAKQLLERQKRADVYEKGYTDLAKGSIAGSAYPVDIADMLTKPALTPPASIKAASLRPRGGGIPETVAPVQDPKLKGTYPYVARKMGLDPDSAENLFIVYTSPPIATKGSKGKYSRENPCCTQGSLLYRHHLGHQEACDLKRLIRDS